MTHPEAFRPGLGRAQGAGRLETWGEILRHHAEAFPDDLAIRFLLDGESKAVTATFADLDRRARAIGANLRDRTRPGDRVLLLFVPGLDYVTAFFGCLYAGAVAVPAYPPDPSPQRLARTLPRLQRMVADSGARTVLTSKMILGIAPALYPLAPELAGLDWVAVDAIPDADAAQWQLADEDPDAIAFLQYTSGSTGSPKGVMLTHKNLLADIEIIQEKFGHTAQSAAVHWLPPYHDMGLIGGILTPVHGGFPAHLMSPMSFLRRPYRWLKVISDLQRPVSAGGPNFAFELCIRKTTPDQRESLDLRRWLVAYTGAEPIRATTLDAFTAAFAPSGFHASQHYPCYGLAEATLLITGGTQGCVPATLTVDSLELDGHRVVPVEASHANARTLVSSGTAHATMHVVIVDPETGAACPPGQVGELWVHSRIVAQGYWRQAARSKEVFSATLGSDKRRYLRTGDLAFIDGEEVYIAGRLKDLIIIRGVNHYPQDIELSVENAHEHLRKGCVAAFSFTRGDVEGLGVVAEVDARSADFCASDVIGAIRREVNANHRINAALVALVAAKSIPKTSSGKIQRFRAKAGALAGSLELVEMDTA